MIIRETCLEQSHVESFVHKTSLKKHQQIEVPGPAKISHDDGVHRHGSQELPPRRRGECRHGHLGLSLAKGVFDVTKLACRDARVFRWLLERQPQPETVPNQPAHT